MSKEICATRADWEPGIRKIESQVKLKYVAEGWHTSPDYEVFYSALDIPNFGQAIDLIYQFGEREIRTRLYYTETQKYLVCSVETEIVARPIPQRAGGILYTINFPENPNAFWFQPGGLYDSSTLIGGNILPGTRVPEVIKLCSKFESTVTKGFVKIKDDENYDWYVGPEALELLRQGGKLVIDSFQPLQLPESMK